MFEKILERVLKKYLAPYVDGISRDGLSILKGDLSLQNLNVKASAFDFLNPLGVLLKSGQVGKLNIQIPWRQLTQGKITIELETIAIAVARIQGDIPDDAQILWDNWQSKIAKIEKKVQEITELAENTGGEENAGYVGRWMHRLAQNIQISLGGGIMMQCFDTKQSLSGGFLLQGLKVCSIGDAEKDPKVAVLQKRIEVTDVAAYVEVDGGGPRYMLEPTRLALTVNHKASSLDAKLELLDREGQVLSSTTNGCRLAISHKALYRLAVTFGEMGAWQAHTQELVSRHCQHIKTDAASLQGETYQQYTQLYRRKLLGADHALTRGEEDTLQSIEEAVMSRHLARWRMEVSEALKTKKTEERKGWRWFGKSGKNGGGQQSTALVEKDEWEQLQQRIREDQAHLADLDRPQTIAVAIMVQHFSLQLYDDSNERRQCVNGADEGIEYKALVRLLDDFDIGAVIKHDMCLDLEQPQTSAKVTPKVVGGFERSEWSFGVCFGRMDISCDQDKVLQYVSPDMQRLSDQLDSHQFKDIAISSTLQEDGTELISANVNLPPIQLFTSPKMVSITLGLVTMDLPEPPKFGSKPRTASELQAEEEERNWYNMHGAYWEEWEDNFTQWKKEVVFEKAEKQAERAKDSSLVFLVDVAVAAPQLTLAVTDTQRIHMDLGRIHLKSDGVMTADNFTASVELSDTQVTCISEASQLPMLEPISLSICVSGHKAKEPTRTSKAKETLKVDSDSTPLEIDLDVQLKQFKFDVYPQAVHLLLETPGAYLSVLGSEGSSAAASGRRATLAAIGTTSFMSVGENQPEDHEDKEEMQPETENANGGGSSPYAVRAKVAMQLISLAVFDMKAARTAHVDIVELGAEGSLLPTGDVEGGVSMQHFLIEVLDTPLVQLRDGRPGVVGQAGKEALGVKVKKQAEQPMRVGVNVCPLQVEWRKEQVKRLMAVVGSCTTPPQATGQHKKAQETELAEATMDQLSEAIQAFGKERRGSVGSMRPKKSTVATALPPKPAVPVKPDKASCALAKQGLAAEGPLPKLRSEELEGDVASVAQTMAVEVAFGGLLIKLHREASEEAGINPVWRGKHAGALVEWHVRDVSANFESFSNGEARCRAALNSFSLLYDGQCIIAPWNSGLSIFESEVRMYQAVEQDGPVHSVCFRGLIRKISFVIFMKHIDSLSAYVSSNISGALVEQAKQEASEAIETPKTTQSVALWNVFVESPVIHLGRDEQMLLYSPAWDGEVEVPGETDKSAAIAGEDSGEEFEDAAEHPTPMVQEFSQYMIFHPGSIQAWNTFEACDTEDPPMTLAVKFTQTNLDAVDRSGLATGSILKIENWEVLVRMDGKTERDVMHLSIGLLFQPITCSLTPEKLELALSVVQENLSYGAYFPVPPPEAPEGALTTTATPTFVDCLGGGTGIASMCMNVRIEFQGLNMTLSTLAPCADGIVPAYRPMLGLAIGAMRIFVDGVMYYGNTPPALRLGVFLNSICANDLRRAEDRRTVASTKLLELTAEGGFGTKEGASPWILVPDRRQGKEMYVPERASLLLLFTMVSGSIELRFELRRPQIFTLLRLVTDAGVAMSDGFARSSMAAYPGPPLPDLDDRPAPVQAQSTLKVEVLIEEASLVMYTSHEQADAPVLQVMTSLSLDLFKTSTLLMIKDVTLSSLSVSRTEALGLEASPSAVQLLRLSGLQISGEQMTAPRPEVDLKVKTQPVTVRMTTGDVPHLIAAISSISGDGPDEAKQAEEALGREQTPGSEAEAQRIQVVAGKLRLLVRRLVDVPNFQSLWVTAHFGGQGKQVLAPWGKPLLLPVPSVKGLGGTREKATDGPMLQLTLHVPTPDGGSEAIGLLSFPVELCTGQGLAGCLLMRSGSPCSQEAARLLGAPGCPGQHLPGGLPQLPELDLEASYEPSSPEDAVAFGLAALCAGEESLDDFLRPVVQLEDFLQESVPRLKHQPSTQARKSLARRSLALRRQSVSAALRRQSVSTRKSTSSFNRRRSTVLPAPQVAAAARPPAEGVEGQPPLALRVLVTCEGLEACFLDDCQANLLPVLRFSMHSRSGLSSVSSPKRLQEGDPSTIQIEMNPWAGKVQRQGMSVSAEKCALALHYLNTRAGCWEPFLEPWEVDVFYSAFEHHSDGSQQAHTALQASDNPMLNARYPAAKEITLMSFGPLNVNVTPQLCSLTSFLMSNKEAYMKQLKSPSVAADATDVAGGARFRLLNMASAPVHLAMLQPGQAAEPCLSSPESHQRLDWHAFKPSSVEAPLDRLLGKMSAEEWRELADETVSCLVHAGNDDTCLPYQGSGPGHLEVLLSSICDGLIPVPGMPQGCLSHVACEVLLPHPSYHLMLISSCLRVFNHTSQPLEVRFTSKGSSGMQSGSTPAPHAAPMSLLSERLAFPPEIAAALRAGEEDAVSSLAPHIAHGLAAGGAEAETGPVPGEPDAQRLPPQHFCAAPIWAAGPDARVQLRLVGAPDWSVAVPLGGRIGVEDPEGTAVLVPSAAGAPLRFHSYPSRSCLATTGIKASTPAFTTRIDAGTSGAVTAMHVCAPLQLLNATPVHLRYAFQMGSSSEKQLTVQVDAFSSCDISSKLDPAQPFALTLAVADERIDPARSPGSPGWAASEAVPHIFGKSEQREVQMSVPLVMSQFGIVQSLGVTVSRGLAVRVSCSRWLVDRTGLGLRVLCSEAPSSDCMALPQVDGHITLIDHMPLQASSGPFDNSKVKAKYHLALRGKDGHWMAMAKADLPCEKTAPSTAVVMPVSSSAQCTDIAGYPVHVCLKTEAVSNRLTFGVPCQVISVLPQVVVYNQLADDTLAVQVVGDASTEISVPAKQNGGFLRWRGEACASSGKSPLALQFRPQKLSGIANWSAPISLAAGETTGPIPLLLTPTQQQRSGCRKTAFDMFTAEVAERGGMVCLTVSRGSRCELQNFSCLVKSATIRPVQGDPEEFVARCFETVDFAWPSVGMDQHLELTLAWAKNAGGTESRRPAPDLRKPCRVVFPAPDGWQAVAIETGSTGDTCWMRVQDIVWTTMQEDSCSQRGDEGPAPAQIKLIVSLAHVGFSLVSPTREQELLYAEIRNAAMLFGQWESSQCVELAITDVQVDSQLLDSKESPVVLANRREPFLQCRVIQQLPASNSVLGIDNLAVNINPLELSINESFLSEVAKAVGDMLQPILSLEELGLEGIEAWRTAPLGGELEAPPPMPTQIAINQFTFLGLEVRLWASIRLKLLPLALQGALGVLTVGKDRLSIQGATLTLDPEVFDNIAGPAATVAMMLLKRYWTNLVLGLASLLGRSTLLELPGLPVKWGRRGVESGMKAINFVFSRTANIFEFCTLDKRYVRRKRPLLGYQIMEVTDFKTGVGAAGQHLAESVMHVGDIVREPFEGAREDGLKGFTVGLGRGLMGTVVQPLLGVCYSCQSLTRGVRLTVAGKDEGGDSQRHVSSRRRPPRIIYAAGAIREYVQAEAAGAER